MKTFNRYDLVPEEYLDAVVELRARAIKCGLTVVDVLDVNLEGTHFKELLYIGTRWSYIKYWCITILKGEVEFGGIPGAIKLMFT